VIRAKGTTRVKYEAAVEFLLEPGDVVQIVSLFPSLPEFPLDLMGVSGEEGAQGGSSSRAGNVGATQRGALGSTATVN
jgi:hypothetical protein